MDKELMQQIEELEENTIVLEIDTTPIDKAIEKVNQLKNLLLEVKDLINSLQCNSVMNVEDLSKELQSLVKRNPN